MIHTRSVRFASGPTTITAVNTFTGDSEFAFDQDIAFGVEDHLTVEIDQTEIQSLMISGGGKALTVCTNGAKAGTPTDTLHVPANGMISWASDDLTACPFTAPITSIYITNEDSAATASVKLRILTKVLP